MTDFGPIDIKLNADGIADILSAFNGVEKRYVAMEKQMSRMAEESATLRARLTKKETDQKTKEEQRAAKEAEKAEATKVKAAEKAESAKVKEATKANKEKEKLQVKELKDQEKLSKELEKIQKKTADAEIKEANRSARERMQISKKLASNILSDLKSTAAFGARIVGGALALAGGAGVYQGVDQYLELDKQASEFHHIAKVTGSDISTQEYKDQARLTGKQYNMSPTDAGQIATTLLNKTGDPKKAFALAPKVAQLAYSEYTDPVELAKTVGQLSVQFKNKSADELMMLAGAAIRTTQFGSIEVPDLVKLVPSVTGVASKFAGSSNDNIIKLLAALQVSNRTAASPEEASVALQRLPDDLLKHSDKLKSKYGLDVMMKDEFGNQSVKPIDVLLPEIFNKIGFNPKKIEEIFGQRSGRFINAFGTAYKEKRELLIGSGLTNKEADKQAKDYALSQLTDFFHNLIITEEDKAKSTKERMETPAEKFKAVILSLQDKFVDLAPAILQLLDSIKPLIPMFGKFLTDFLAPLLEWTAQHPWEALGAAITAAIVKSIAAAMIGSAIKDVAVAGITGSLAGSAGTIAFAGPIGVAIAAAITAATLKWSLDQISKAYEQNQTLNNSRNQGMQQDFNAIQIGQDEITKKGFNLPRLKLLQHSSQDLLENYDDKLTQDQKDDLNNKLELYTKQIDNLIKNNPADLEATNSNTEATKLNTEATRLNRIAIENLMKQNIPFNLDNNGSPVVKQTNINRNTSGTLNQSIDPRYE